MRERLQFFYSDICLQMNIFSNTSLKLRAQPAVRAICPYVFLKTWGTTGKSRHTKFCVSAKSKIRRIPYVFVRRRYLPLTDPRRLPTFWHVDSTHLQVRRVVPLALLLIYWYSNTTHSLQLDENGNGHFEWHPSVFFSVTEEEWCSSLETPRSTFPLA